MPGEMHFKRDWDFSQGNKPIMLNDLTNDSDTRDAILALLGIIIGNGDALNIEFSPTGTLSATNVQAAIEELDADTSVKVANAVNALVSGAPGALDTLDELAAALGDDANFAASVTNLLAAKQDAGTLDYDVATYAADSGSELGAYLATLGGGGGGGGGGTISVYTGAKATYVSGYTSSSPIPLATEVWDTSGIHDAAQPSRFTVPAGMAGKWRFDASIQWAAGGTGSRGFYWYKNGAFMSPIEGGQRVPVPDNTPMMSGGFDIELAVGDYIELVPFNTGGALGIDGAAVSCRYLEATATIASGGGGAAGALHYDEAIYTGGDLSISSTTFASLSGTTFDCTVTADAGDRLMVMANILPGSAAPFMAFDVGTVVSGAVLNRLSGTGSGDNGISGWDRPGGTQIGISGVETYEVQAGDVVSGTVTVRPLARVDSGSRGISASTATPVRFSVFNLTKLVGGSGGSGAPAQRVLLSDTTLSAAAASVDVPSISQAYDDLELIFEGRHATASGAVSVRMALNNDTTAANYIYQLQYFAGGTVGAGSGADSFAFQTHGSGTQKTSASVRLHSYTRTDWNKGFTSTVGQHGVVGLFLATEWASTAAVNRITLTLADGGNFAVGTRVRLYGLKDVTEAQAGGGSPFDYRATVLRDKPRLYLPLSETSGTIAADSSGYARHGTYNGAGNLVADTGVAGGRAWEQDGSAAKHISTAYATNYRDELTVEIWCKPTSAQPASSSTLISKSAFYAPDAAQFPLKLLANNGASKVFGFSVDSGNDFSQDVAVWSPTAWTADTWYHVVGVFKQGFAILYVNGVEVARSAANFSLSSSGQVWRVGAMTDFDAGTGASRFSGRMAHAALYSDGLSAGQVAEHYAAGRVV